jgi:transposase InsO family protein
MFPAVPGAAVTLEEVRDGFDRIKVGWFVASTKDQELCLRELLEMEHQIHALDDSTDPLLRIEIRDLKLQLAERLGM